jgi:hypothetical protein
MAKIDIVIKLAIKIYFQIVFNVNGKQFLYNYFFLFFIDL